VATIATLRARFQFLRDTFSFPEHLEFKAQEQGTNQEHEEKDSLPALLFTSANAAVHTYVHELTKLLTLADAVSSCGSERVREERRSFVRLVEEALDSVDRRVATVWGKKSETATATPSEGGDALVASSPATPIIDAPPSASKSLAQSSGESSPSLGSGVSVQGGGPTTADAEPRVSMSVSASRDDSDEMTDVSTIIPSRVEIDGSEGVSVDAVDADDEASERPVRDVVSEDISSPLEGEDEGENHGEADQDRLESVNIDEAASEGLDSAQADLPAPSSLFSGSPQVDLEAAEELQPSVAGHGITLASTSVSDSSALDATTAVESFDVVYPDSSSSSSVADEGDVVGAQDVKRGGETEGFEWL
jgi:hypothetical protein